ncbi:MAG TPA: hypothetical protein VNI34_05455 [Candidatus Nitrosotalea sp.]|nr:hypothetical protein [Candidatus Nitrosotalea sp.]
MAIDLEAETRVEASADLAVDGPTAASEPLTAITVYDGEWWISVCRDLGISTQATSAQDAFLRLRSAVREATEVAAENGIEPGEPMTDAEVEAFLRSHQGTSSIQIARILD